MKIARKTLKTAFLMYVYPHYLVIVHEKVDRDAGVVRWVTLHDPEALGLDILFKEGRLIVEKAAIPMILAAKGIDARLPSQGNGSPSTRSLGIEVASIHLNYGSGFTYLFDLPGLLSGDVKYRRISTILTWDEVRQSSVWDMYPVREVA